jgi:aspartate dehydrogenase
MVKNKKLRIGICGCGAIGSSLAKRIVSGFKDEAKLVGLYDTDRHKAESLAKKISAPRLPVSSLKNLIAKSDLIIEAAKMQSAFEIAKEVLLASRDIMTMSVGGLLSHYKELKKIPLKNGARIFIPSGAVSGIDGLKAASCSKIKKVILTTRKPAKAFSGVPYVLEKKIDLDSVKGEFLLFEGNAIQATRFFPQNINVAATLSLAGIGPKKTIVRIVASDKISRNIHEIEVEADSGRIFSRTENLVHRENPKTSYLAVLSAVATLKQILDPVKIGN